MSASIIYRVKVLVSEEAELDVSAVTEQEAREEALRKPGVISVISVHSEVCSNCDTAMPVGCGGLFQKDGAVCLWFKARS